MVGAIMDKHRRFLATWFHLCRTALIHGHTHFTRLASTSLLLNARHPCRPPQHPLHRCFRRFRRQVMRAREAVKDEPGMTRVVQQLAALTSELGSLYRTVMTPEQRSRERAVRAELQVRGRGSEGVSSLPASNRRHVGAGQDKLGLYGGMGMGCVSVCPSVRPSVGVLVLYWRKGAG